MTESIVMRSLTVSGLLTGGGFKGGMSLEPFMRQVRLLVIAGEIREVTALRNLTDFGAFTVTEDLYFSHDPQTTYHLLPRTGIRPGRFMRIRGDPVPAIAELEIIDSQEQNESFRAWMRGALRSRLLDEITLLQTFGTAQYRHFDRVFETEDGDYLEVIGPDGPFSGWYGRLGDFDRRQPPSYLWSFLGQNDS